MYMRAVSIRAREIRMLPPRRNNKAPKILGRPEMFSAQRLKGTDTLWR
ncbi:hypothetical protein A33Q_4488 [Indibacter alkaliphilus LW1]|uniref:Uncharacterized protein n=1 Tax=Indibacter alkaliphilus (strain CCUG 57479 / KCTC 22604 / LW1) TaxID=1189612 RepID=S2D5P4_INDAL|nr:hypothetical protein A33Q_4488 [Indibacter alkaliphilus LW1]